MHSAATNNDSGIAFSKITNSSNRPNLSINTNIKKKKWSQIFSSKDSFKFDRTPTKDSNQRNSLPSPPSGQHHMQYVDSPSSRVNGSTDNLETPRTSLSSDGVKPNSLDNSSLHSQKSAGSLFKKLQVPHFYRSTTSPTTKAEACMYDPVAPEPIMPALVDWSPEAPLSPPPWELHEQKHHEPLATFAKNKRHSSGFHNSFANSSIYEREYEEEEDDSITTLDSSVAEYNSDSEIGYSRKFNLNTPTSDLSPSNSIGRKSDLTLVGSTLSADEISRLPHLRRRSSCPNYDRRSLSSTSTSSTNALVDNDIITITEQHTRNMSVFKTYTHPADKKPALKSCQKAKARAAEAAITGTVAQHSNSFYAPFCEESLKYLYIPNVFDPVTGDPILEFSAIKPRKYQLHRKTSWKREAKALMTWHHALEANIKTPNTIIPPSDMSREKEAKNNLTRKFIMREFFITEVNFWNQLYYTKIIFYDAIVTALNHNSPFVKETNVDPFANLFDLMQFSAKLINRLRHFEMGHKGNSNPILPKSVTSEIPSNTSINCNTIQVGKALCDMAEELVVFLRCAIDYKGNRKVLERNENNKGFLQYRQKLNSRKETSQFELNDFLIIPIQRVARYGLLFSDLIKRTEISHPDYEHLVMAHKIVTSLAHAMNSVQKKN